MMKQSCHTTENATGMNEFFPALCFIAREGPNENKSMKMMRKKIDSDSPPPRPEMRGVSFPRREVMCQGPNEIQGKHFVPFL